MMLLALGSWYTPLNMQQVIQNKREALWQKTCHTLILVLSDLLPEAPCAILKFSSCSARVAFSTAIAGKVRASWRIDGEANTTIQGPRGLWRKEGEQFPSITVDADSPSLIQKPPWCLVAPLQLNRQGGFIQHADPGIERCTLSWPLQQSSGQMQSVVVILPADACCLGCGRHWNMGCSCKHTIGREQ